MQNPPQWIEIKHGDEVVTIEFTLTPTQAIEPMDIPQAVEYVYQQLQGQRRIRKIRVTGRGPIWLYAAIVHTVAHLCECVQVFDAVQRRWITVVTHSNICKLGEIEYA